MVRLVCWLNTSRSRVISWLTLQLFQQGGGMCRSPLGTALTCQTPCCMVQPICLIQESQDVSEAETFLRQSLPQHPSLRYCMVQPICLIAITDLHG